MANIPRPDPPEGYSKKKNTARGYGAAWRKVRKAKLARDPLCQLRLDGCTLFADQVHHADHDAHNNTPTNHISTCKSCHLKHHASHR